MLNFLENVLFGLLALFLVAISPFIMLLDFCIAKPMARRSINKHLRNNPGHEAVERYKGVYCTGCNTWLTRNWYD